MHLVVCPPSQLILGTLTSVMDQWLDPLAAVTTASPPEGRVQVAHCFLQCSSNSEQSSGFTLSALLQPEVAPWTVLFVWPGGKSVL